MRGINHKNNKLKPTYATEGLGLTLIKNRSFSRLSERGNDRFSNHLSSEGLVRASVFSITRVSVVGSFSAYRLHVVAGHRDGETPIDEGQGGEEAYHHHILCVACLKEEEADEQQQDAVDEIHPPVAVGA